MKKSLGQYMTPEKIARLVASEIGECDALIDFAVGTGELLHEAFKANLKPPQLIGFDIDDSILKLAQTRLPECALIHGDGLSSRLPRLDKYLKVGVIGNPPYLVNLKKKSRRNWIFEALGKLQNQNGLDRAEVHFLCRSLMTAKRHKGKVVIVMPMSFADGDKYAAIRSAIMEQFHVQKCIELPAGIFIGTEARTALLVIDTVLPHPDQKHTEICLLEIDQEQPIVVYKNILALGARLDARYYSIAAKAQVSTVLADLGVSITRGLFSRKFAQDMNFKAIHTSDLERIGQTGGKLDTSSHDGQTFDTKEIITVQSGDILLARTGKRVYWDPILVSSGNAPITDHVFRIRVSEDVRDIVQQSFFHPYFKEWLNATCKGVCATVLTKRELLNMPVFALEGMGAI